jgi:GTPase KRas protein
LAFLIQRYVQNKFVRDYDPTIEDYYKKVANIDGETVPLSIFDTAGMEDYYPLIDEWIDKKDGFILVYSMDIKDSLQKLTIFIEKIKHRYSGHGRPDPVVVIVGNKLDIPNKEISPEEGRRFADNCSRKHFEVSAATGIGIDDVFTCIIRELKTRREEKPVNSSTSWWSSCNLL